MKYSIIIALVLGVASAADLKLGFPKDDRSYSISQGRIIRGENAPLDKVKYIVSLSSSKSVYQHSCGGSLINENWIVTAAHCITGDGKGTMIYAGLYNKSDRKNGQQLEAKETIIHPGYSGGVGPNDIALIRLVNPVQFNEYVQPIRLPEAEEEIVGDCQLYGWGQVKPLQFGVSPDILQTMNSNLLSYEECKVVMPADAPIAESNVCSSPMNNKLSACNGDSGGPLVQENGDEVLVGIVSWGYIPCGSAGYPSVYTKVASHRRWIDSTIN